MRNFDYHRATDASAAIAQHRGQEAAAFIAGGTTLVDLMRLNVMRPAQLIDLNRIGLDRIEPDGHGGLRIGAMVRNSALAHHGEVRRRYPVLAQAILSGASVQLRNRATTGGNLLQRTRCPYFRDDFSPCNKRAPGSGCAAMEGYNRSHAILGTSDRCIATHPSDLCVALAALDATVVLQGAAGERRLPFGEFHLLPGATPDRETALEPGELISAVTVPALPDGTRSWYCKVRDRQSFEFALASAAVVLRMQAGVVEDVRIALGGVATKPWRATAAERALKGKRLDDAILARAASAAVGEAMPRQYNAFKVELVRRIVNRTVRTLVEGQPEVVEV